MLFGMWGGGPSNHVLDGGPDPPWEGAILGWRMGHPIVKYMNCWQRKNAGSIGMAFGM